MLSLLLAVGVGNAADDTSLKRPDPVLEEVKLDLRTSRKARFFLSAAVAGPGLYLLGSSAVTTFRADRVNAQLVTGFTLGTLGIAAVLAAPPLALYHAKRGRRALERQGLDVAGVGITAGYVASVVASLGVLSSMQAIVDGSIDENRGPLIISSTLYVGSLGIAVAQLSTNHRARKNAGWLGVVPSTVGTAPGVVVAVIR